MFSLGTTAVGRAAGSIHHYCPWANDSGTLSAAPIEEGYAKLIDELAKHTPKILLTGRPPFEMGGELAGRYFDQASANRNNAAIYSLATTRNLAVY